MTADQRSPKKNKKRVSKNLLTKIDKYREKWYVYLSVFFARVLSEYYGSRGEFNNIKNDVCKVGLLGFHRLSVCSLSIHQKRCLVNEQIMKLLN